MITELRQVLLNLNKGGMILYIKNTPAVYPDLIKLALTDEPRYSWRAAWLLWSVMESNDKRLRKHLQKIAAILPERNESHQRELIIILNKMTLPDEITSQLFDYCTTLWNDTSRTLSLRYNAFKLMAKIAQEYPELIPELKMLAVNDNQAGLPRSLRRCADKILRGSYNAGDKQSL